ncbi:MAG: LPS assembly protein LptD [Planctomycetota bacterium]
MRVIARPCAWMLVLAAVAGAGELPRGVQVEGDLFAGEGQNILYAIGNVRLSSGREVISADGAVIWWREQEAYLEGNVVYRFRGNVLKAERVYVHWTTTTEPETGQEETGIERSFVVRADVRWAERPDRVPWRVRAEEVLQTQPDRFVARGRVDLSTCLYHEPHAYFRASKVVFVADQKIIVHNLSYQVQGVALDPDIQGWWVPPIYWPYLYVPLGYQWPEMSFDVGRSGRFGSYVQTEVRYPLLAEDATPLGVPKLGVRLDYYSKRGFAYGTSLGYERRDGQVRGRLDYYRLLDDEGEERDEDEFELGETERYRWKFFHTQDMPEGWEFDAEWQKWSDAGFRQEFFERDFYTEKPIESRLYLKRAEGPLAGYAHVRWQQDEWLDTTEYLPQVGFNVISWPLGPHLIYTAHFEVAHVRRRLSELRLPPPPWTPAQLAAHDALLRDRNFFQDPLESTVQEAMGDDERFWRFNTYHALSAPFELGGVDIEPFVGFRGTYYSDTVDGGSGWRRLLVWGGRASAQYWRTWEDVRSDGLRCMGRRVLPLEVNGLRHVITPEVRIVALEDSGVDYDELILTDDDELQPIGDFGHAGFRLQPGIGADRLMWPGRPRPWYGIDTTTLAFGDVNDIVPYRVLNVGLRNRLQTRRRGRIVDLLDVDADVDFFFGDQDVNNGDNVADARLDLRFRPLEGVTFFADIDYNVGSNDYLRRRDDGTRFFDDDSVSAFNAGLYLHTSRRWQVVLEQRYEADESNQLGVRFVFQPDRKWQVELQYRYDTEESDPVDVGVVLRRDMHDWIAELIFEDDDLADESIVGFRLQPKLRRRLVTGLTYTRELGANIDRHDQEQFQHYDY